MDIEHLSKSQIVLLTLLVSFVTSIATGIVTVSLMDQAPPAIAQTVNRVIERTVEKVAPAGQAAAVVTQQKTVVVKESDLIAQAVDRANGSVVRLYTNASDQATFLGLAVVLDGAGRLASDGTAIDAGDAVAELADGSHVRAFVESRDQDSGVAYFRTATSTSDDKPIRWNPIAISSSNPVLGETVVSLAGRTVARIADGIVTELIPGKAGVSAVVDTSISTDTILPGSPLIGTDGSLIGMSTGASRAVSGAGFVSASVLMAQKSAGENP